MDQPDLFDEILVSHEKYNLSLLDYYAQQGFMFLTIKQVQQVLNKTYGQVRYAIFSYELDAFLISAGDYRITHQAVRDYIEGLQERYEETYHYLMSRRELSGVYDLARGADVAVAVRSIKTKRYPITAIDGLLDKDQFFHYDDLPSGSTVQHDYYDVDSLSLPEKLSMGDIACILNVDVAKILKEFRAFNKYDLIPLKAFKTYLISREVVNLNIPIFEGSSQSDSRVSGQLDLF